LTFADENAAVFKLENVILCWTDVSSVPELIDPRAVASPEAGSRFMLAMFVADVDAACSELAQYGVVLLNGPVRPGKCAPLIPSILPVISGRSAQDLA
jgi:hypothetical protein